MREALNSLNDSTEPQTLSLKYGLFTSWIGAEAYNRDCDYTNDILDEFSEFMESNPVPNVPFNKLQLKEIYLSPISCEF